MADNNRAIMKGLRKVFDGGGTFMSGHQVVRSRESIGITRRIPAWTSDDAAVRSLLLGAFPLLASDPRQRARAGRWMRIIQMYFRSKMAYPEIMAEMGTSQNVIKMLLRSITRASRKRRGNSGRPYGARMGRPKLSCDTPQTPDEGTNKDL